MLRGAVAQLGERLNGIQEVRGSTPLGSTTIEWNGRRREYLPAPLLYLRADVPKRVSSSVWESICVRVTRGRLRGRN